MNCSGNTSGDEWQRYALDCTLNLNPEGYHAGFTQS